MGIPGLSRSYTAHNNILLIQRHDSLRLLILIRGTGSYRASSRYTKTHCPVLGNTADLNYCQNNEGDTATGVIIDQT